MSAKLIWVDSLRPVINDDELRWFAGEQALLAGRDLSAQGKVKFTDAGSVWLDAIVSDGQDFAVDISLMHDCDLDYQCSCPLGRKEIFCAHCVAASVSWLSSAYDDKNRYSTFAAGPGLEPSPSIIPLLRQCLDSMPREGLIELLLNWAERDPALQRHLSSFSTLGPNTDLLLTALRLRDEIDQAFDQYLYVPDNNDEVQVDLDELQVALEEVINQPEVAGNPNLLRNLTSQCLDRFRESMSALRDLGEEERALEIMDLLEGWEHQ